MATPPDRSRKVNAGVHSLGSVRRQMEEAMGKLDIMEEEATLLVIDDSVECSKPKWLLAGMIL